MLAIYLPSYKRPQSILKVADNLKKATRNPYKLYVGLEVDDHESILLAKDNGLNVVLNEYSPSYANTTQTIYEHTKEDIFFPANDDFKFLDGWDVEPLRRLEADPSLMVLSVPDGNPGTAYMTVMFIKRKYIEEKSGVVDLPNRVFYPYRHNYTDTEFNETAKKRGVWGFSTVPCIEHQHPSFTWLGDFPTDDTYRKNDAAFAQDYQTFASRKHLWENL